MKNNKSHKRKRGKDPLVDGEPESAQAVTYSKVEVTRRDGTTTTRQVLESLDMPPQPLPPKPLDRVIRELDVSSAHWTHEDTERSPPPPRHKVRIHCEQGK